MVQRKKKLYLSLENKKKRIEWAQEWLEKTQRKNVLLSSCFSYALQTMGTRCINSISDVSTVAERAQCAATEENLCSGTVREENCLDICTTTPPC